MKKNILLPIILSLLLGACKKGNDYVYRDAKFNFEINGVKYTKTITEGRFVSGTGTPGDFCYDYIEFKDPVNTGNYIRMYANSNSCAYSVPGYNNGFITDFTACTLAFYNPPTDPSRVYHYQSGSLVYSRSDCYAGCYVDFLGFNHCYRLCTVSGVFNLTLVNNFGQTIVITNGEFLLFKVSSLQ